MSQDTQAVVIYNNPYSQTFWESGMAFPLGVSLFVLFISIVVGMKLIEHYTKFNTMKRLYSSYICISVAVVLAGTTFWKMVL